MIINSYTFIYLYAVSEIIHSGSQSFPQIISRAVVIPNTFAITYISHLQLSSRSSLFSSLLIFWFSRISLQSLLQPRLLNQYPWYCHKSKLMFPLNFLHINPYMSWNTCFLISRSILVPSLKKYYEKSLEKD